METLAGNLQSSEVPCLEAQGPEVEQPPQKKLKSLTSIRAAPPLEGQDQVEKWGGLSEDLWCQKALRLQWLAECLCSNKRVL